MPWMFLLNVLLAIVPMYEAILHHPLWFAVVVYCVVLAVLLKLDSWTAGKGWASWKSVALKIAVAISAQAAVLIAAMETCNPADVCQRTFF